MLWQLKISKFLHLCQYFLDLIVLLLPVLPCDCAVATCPTPERRTPARRAAAIVGGGWESAGCNDRLRRTGVRRSVVGSLLVLSAESFCCAKRLRQSSYFGRSMCLLRPFNVFTSVEVREPKLPFRMNKVAVSHVKRITLAHYSGYAFVRFISARRAISE